MSDNLKLLENSSFYISKEAKDIHYQYIKNEIFDLQIYDIPFCSLPRRKVVIDTGANIGMFAHYAITKKNNYVFCFEPAQNCLEALHKNLEGLNKRYSIIEKGLWNKPDTLEFMEHDEFPGCNQLLEFKNEYTRAIEVTTIDTFVSEQMLGQVDFIKMDIEGAELQALEGGLDTIKRFRPKMAISAYHKPNDEQDIIKFMEANTDYKLTVVYHVHIGIKIVYCT